MLLLLLDLQAINLEPKAAVIALERHHVAPYRDLRIPVGARAAALGARLRFPRGWL